MEETKLFIQYEKIELFSQYSMACNLNNLLQPFTKDFDEIQTSLFWDFPLFFNGYM